MARTRRYNKHKAKKHTRRMRRKVKKHSRRMRRKSSFRKTKHKKKRGGAELREAAAPAYGEIEMTSTDTDRGEGADAENNKLIVTSAGKVRGHPQYQISYNDKMKHDISSYVAGNGKPFRMNQARNLQELLASFHHLQDVTFPERIQNSRLRIFGSGLTDVEIAERTNGLNKWFNAAYEVRQSLMNPGEISEGSPEGGREGERLFLNHFNKILPDPDPPNGAGQTKDVGTPGHGEMRGIYPAGPKWTPLPGGWELADKLDEHGMPYYLNRKTGETSKDISRIIRET